MTAPITSELNLATRFGVLVSGTGAADTITPVSSRKGPLPSDAPCRKSRRARPYSSSATVTAPPKAARSTIQAAGSSSIAASAPTEAPPEMPST